MIEAQALTFRAGAATLISEVSTTFDAGKLHLIIGPNGAGKSTLVKLLARLLRPNEGHVRYRGVDVAPASPANLAKRRAVLSQAIEIAFPLSVREVVTMGRYPHFGTHAGARDEAIVDEVMGHFELESMTARDYTTLSGGEKQRVNFARVLAQVWQPIAGVERVLFLDEPLTFLDVRHQLDFMRKVRAAAADDLVIIGVIHDLNLAARFADRLLMLDRGRVAAMGPPAEVLTPANVRAVFGVSPITVDAPGGAQFLFE
jgi:iron complex transport system ATP-binding protein